MHVRRTAFLVPCVLLTAVLAAPPAGANHSWGGYHWGRQSNPFTVGLGNNVTSAWESYLGTTSSDWSKSSVLDTVIVAGGGARARCKATSGRVEVCNDSYGFNQWLGVAQVWTSGSHIVQGTVKMNDSYFNTSRYDTPAWRNLVMCQEVGHTFGLDHQDENFDNANLGTCMDYTNDPSSNQHPNQHDYDQLVTIYSHLDSVTTVGSVTAAAPSPAELERQDQWGRALRLDGRGRPVLFERSLGGGHAVFTFVIWA